MAVYQPGQGLNEDALARLRGRKDLNKVFSDIPAQDSSKQWDHLLGSGSTKKLRCSQCTRPLTAADPSARHLLCQRCLPRHELPEEIIEDSEMVRAHAPAAPTREPRFLHLDSCTEKAQARLESLPQTPSTEAAISEEDGEGSAEPSRSYQDAVWAAIKQHLLGEWLGPRGEHYKLSLSQDERQVLCMMKEKEDSLKEEPLTLFLDVKERLVWWGINRSYFLDLTEKLAERLVWHDSGNGTANQRNIEWKRSSGLAANSETGDAAKTVRVKRWAKPEEAPEVPMPVALVEAAVSKKGSNKIRQVERQEAEVRPAKVIEPIEVKSVASKVLAEPAPEVTSKVEVHKEEMKQKVVPSQAKVEKKREETKVDHERKEEWKDKWKEPSDWWEDSKANRSSSSGQARKVIWRDWRDESNDCAKEQTETKVKDKEESNWGWSVDSGSKESKSRRVVPSPAESKSTTAAQRDTKQDVKVWKPVETEDGEAKSVEAKQEVKVWRPVEAPKEEVKSKLVEPKQEAKVWRPVETPKEETKAKSVEPKQEVKVWRPVEAPKEEVNAKSVEPRQEAKVWKPVEAPREEVQAKSVEPKQEVKVWRPVETPKEDKAKTVESKELKVWKPVQPLKEEVKPKEASKYDGVKVWRAVGGTDTKKAELESFDVRKDEAFQRKDDKWIEKKVEKWPEKKVEKWPEKKVETWPEKKKWEDESWLWEEETWHGTKLEKSWKDPEMELARAAIRIITAQVQVPENKGFVWVDEWQERFSSTLGTVREFLESRPDKFVVMPTSGRGYRVALVNEGPLKWKARRY